MPDWCYKQGKPNSTMYLGNNRADWFQPPTLFSQPEVAASTPCLYAKLCDRTMEQFSDDSDRPQ